MVRRSDGRWQQSVTDIDAFGRRKTKYFYGKTKSELLQKIAAYNAETAGRKRGVTFQTLADGWWEEAEPALAPNTTKGYKAAMRRAAGHFGTAYAQELRPVDVSRFIKTFCKETNAAEKTARNQLSVISLILSWGVDHGYLDTNVAREVSVPKGLPKRKVEMPSSEDIRRVKENTDLPFGMFAYWAMYTGLRHGELLALTWEDVNIEKRTITVNKSLYHVGGQKTKAPKTEAGTRVLPLLDRLDNAVDVLNESEGIYTEPVMPYTPESEIIQSEENAKQELTNTIQSLCEDMKQAKNMHALKTHFQAAYKMTVGMQLQQEVQAVYAKCKAKFEEVTQ